MEIRQLEYFLALCEKEHISSTAAFLGISQPALSKSISNLESEIGTKLFDRHKNHIKLNDYGRTFEVYAKNALFELRKGVHQIHQSQYDICGEIHIACYAFADSIIDCILAYYELNPKIKINIIQSTTSNKPYDFILTTQSDPALMLKGDRVWYAYPLFEENYGALISPRYSEYSEEVKSIDMTDLANERFVILPDYSFYYTDITYKLCRAAGFHPKIACATDDFLTKMRFVDSGKAISILPRCCLSMAKKISPDVRFLEIKDMDTRRTVYLLRQKESMMSEAVQDFWAFVQDYYSGSE